MDDIMNRGVLCRWEENRPRAQDFGAFYPRVKGFDTFSQERENNRGEEKKYERKNCYTEGGWK